MLSLRRGKAYSELFLPPFNEDEDDDDDDPEDEEELTSDRLALLKTWRASPRMQMTIPRMFNVLRDLSWTNVSTRMVQISWNIKKKIIIHKIFKKNHS